QELKAVLPALENERKRLNVPFDIVVLKIEEESMEPEILNGDFYDLQLMYTKVRQDIICNNLNIGEDIIPPDLKDFDCENLQKRQDNAVNQGDGSLACNVEVLKELCSQYKERLQRLQEIQYFHHF